MKTLKLTPILFGLMIFASACSEKDPEITPQPRGGKFTVTMNHEVNGKSVETDKFLYMTEAGDSFQVTLLQYYISNIQVHSPESGWRKLNNYQLVRLNAEGTHAFDLNDLPFGNYDSIQFFLGIDSVTNHDIDRLGELDAGYGMIWTWNSGYIFYMFEGKFINSSGVSLPFAYHIGGDEYLNTYSFAFNEAKPLNASNLNQTINLTLEMDQVFRSPNLIKLNEVPLVSHTFDEPAFTHFLQENLKNAFSVE